MKKQTFDRKELKKLGTVLYGTRWKAPLSRALGVSDRYLRMLAGGQRPIPPALVCDLERLCYERVTLLDRWNTRLGQITAPKRIAHD